MTYDTTPVGDAFLREFIIKWMKERGYDIPAAASPSELLETISANRRAQICVWPNCVCDEGKCWYI